MSRILLKSVRGPPLRQPTALISHLRHRSSKTHSGQIIEVDLSSSQQDSGDLTAEAISVGIQKLEDTIQGIIVRRAAPDWLPFLPGCSYWVPARPYALRDRHAASLVDVFFKLGSPGGARNQSVTQELSEDQQMSLTSSKGWPSSAVFIEGVLPVHPIPAVEVEIKLQDNKDHTDDL